MKGKQMIQNNNTNNAEKMARIPFHGGVILARQIDSDQIVALKPICENIGIDFEPQRKRLLRQAWAVTSIMEATGSDGKTYQMFAVNRKTLVMWLATIDASRLKNETTKSMVVAYQRECAEALDAYFSDGIAVNRHRLEAAHHDRMSQIELLKANTGLVHPDFLEAKARIVIARELGETPELDPMRRPLYTQDYLREKNLGARQCRSKAPTFGKRLKAAYESRHGRPPARADLTLPNGRIIQVNAYTEADRPLFDQVWRQLEQDNGNR